MALRSLIPIEDVRVAHVNSEDNSTTYESGVAYKAGTLVTYEGVAYVAASDIAEDDTDLPNEAPSKWGIAPNAFTSGGDDSGLASRVTTLEGEMDTAQADILNLQSNSLVKMVDQNVAITSGTTIIDAVTSVMDALVDYALTLEDDEIIVPLLINVPLDASGNLIALHVAGQYLSNISNYSSRLDICEGRVSYTNVKVDLYAARAGCHDQTNKTFQHFVINNGSVTAEDLSAITLTTNITSMFRAFVYKRISS